MSPRPSSPELTEPVRTRTGTGARVLAVAALGAGVVAACLPWSVTSPRLLAMVADDLARSYGIALTADGPTEIALLPFPRLNVSGTRLTAGGPDGAILAEGGQLSLQLSLVALAMGRVDLDAVSLDGAAVTLPLSETDDRWRGPMERIVRRFGSDAESRPLRLGLTRATVTVRDPRDGAIQTVSDVTLGLTSPFWGTRAEIVARGIWRERDAQLRLSGLDLPALLDGRVSRFAATASWPAATFDAKGSVVLGARYAVSGHLRLASQSLPEMLDWSGVTVALAPLLDALVVESDFTTEAGTLILPRLRVEMGGNRLEGAGSLALAGGRPAIQATLAAETLNIAPLVRDLATAFGIEGDARPASEWTGRSLSLAAATMGDLDLRLSAAETRVGPLLVEDVAAGLIVRSGNVEASLGRANLQGGTLKGRVVLGDPGEDRGTEVKAQGAFEGVDLGALLTAFGEERWLVGPAKGSFAMDSRAATMGDLVANANGRAGLAVEGGAISGLDLGALLQRPADAAAGSPQQRIGRTDFSSAAVTLRFKDGQGTVTQGRLAAPTVAASLAGTISLDRRHLDIRAGLSPAETEVPLRQFGITGPWDAIVVRALLADASEAGPRGLAVMKPDLLRLPAKAALPATARSYAP